MKIKSVLFRIRFALKIAKIAYRYISYPNMAFAKILEEYSNTPIAEHAKMYLAWLNSAKYYEMHYEENKITVIFHEV